MRATKTIIYADGGVGKTSTLAMLAKEFHERTGKRTRLIAADPGGWGPFELEGLINPENPLDATYPVSGFFIGGRPSPMADCKRLGEGYWPRIDTTGTLQFLTDDRFKTNWDNANVGMYMVESLWSLAQAMLTILGDSENLPKALSRAYGYEEGGEVFGSPGGEKGSHYGLVQLQIYKLVAKNLSALPIEHVFCTSLVARGDDTNSKIPIYGPQSSGNAQTAVIPSWFNHCLHMQNINAKQDGVVRQAKVFWFEDHLDSITGFPYKTKISIPISSYGKFKEAHPHGFIVSNPAKGGLLEYFHEIDRVVKG